VRAAPRPSWAFAALLTISTLPALAAERDVEVRASLEPDPVGLEETVQLTLEIEARGFRLPEVEHDFRLENLEQLGPPLRAQSHSWVNGETTSRLEMTWRLRPERLGAAAVRGIRVSVGGAPRELADLAVRVVERAPPRPRGQRRANPLDPFGGLFDEDPFAPFLRREGGVSSATPIVRLRAEAAPARVYVGQQAVWRLSVETQTDIGSFQLRSLPEFAGFWSRELELPERPSQESIELEGQRGARFAVVERALFALRPGTYTLEPARARLVARVVGAGLFGRLGRDVPLDLESAPAVIAVRPLPPGAPDDFSGLVGGVSILGELTPVRVGVGGAATLRLRIAGDANFEGVSPPVLDLPAGLRAFPPTRELEERRADLRLESLLTWSYVVVADRPGSFRIPPVRLTFFDPFSGEYRTVETMAFRLAAVAEAGGPAATVPQAEAPEAAVPSRLPLRLESRRWLRKGLFIALGLLLVAGLVGIGLRLGRRSSGAGRLLRTRLDAARAVAAPRATAREIDEAWRSFLDERFELSRSVTTGQWASHLASKGVDRAAAEELIALFEELHLLEFAPELADAEALRDDLFRRSRALSRRLR